MVRSGFIIFVLVNCLYFANTLDVAESPEPEDAKDAEYKRSFSPPQISIVPPPPFPRQLECYACLDCPQVDETTSVRRCFSSPDPKRNKCVTYVEQYKHMKKPWYIRGCASERGTCEDLKKSHSGVNHVQLLSCKECEGDRCNGVSRSFPDLIMAFSVLILAPLLTKYTFS